MRSLYILLGNTAQCAKLTVEDLSCYANKTESRISWYKKLSVLSPPYYESDVAVTSISQSLPHILAGKQLA